MQKATIYPREHVSILQKLALGCQAVVAVELTGVITGNPTMSYLKQY